MKVIIATGNRHKVAELSELFAPYNNKGYEFVSMRDAGFTAISLRMRTPLRATL